MTAHPSSHLRVTSHVRVTGHIAWDATFGIGREPEDCFSISFDDTVDLTFDREALEALHELIGEHLAGVPVEDDEPEVQL